MATVSIEVSHADGGAPSVHEFATSPIRIGRNERNDLPLPYSSVSGWHAMVRFDGQQALFVDLGSTNGTYCRGQRITANAPVAIEHELVVTIDKISLRVRYASRADVGASRVMPMPRGPSTGGSKAVTPHAAPPNAAAPPTASPAPAPASHGNLERLAASLLPPAHQPHGPADLAAFGHKIYTTLQTMARCFVALQAQLDQLEGELNVPLLRDRGPLQQADDPAELLAYLLDFRPADDQRTAQLASSLEQLMMHQVALFNAMLVGARAALRSIDPDVIEQVSTGRWPTSAHARWRVYRQRFAELTQDANLLRAVFGDAFRERYPQRDDD